MVQIKIGENVNKIWVIIAVLLASLLLLNLFYALPSSSNNAEHYYLLGKAYETQGYYEKAKASYEKSVALSSNSVVYNALGNLHEFLGDNIAAINAYKEGIALDKDDTENLFDVSRVYTNIKDYGKAEEALLSIISNGKETASVYALLGTVYIETKKWDKAEASFKKSLQLQERASTYNDLGVVYENMKNLNLAIENYQKALQLNPDFELASRNLERLGR